MKKTYSTTFVSLVAIFSFFFAINQSQAYFTTSQNQIDLKDGSALFIINFSFGVEKHDINIPIASHMNPESASNAALSYSIYDEDEEIVDGVSSSIVLSSLPLAHNTFYTVPKGKVGHFSLITVFTPKKPTKINQYRLQVTSLPFNFDGNQQLRLQPSELQYYTTKLIEI